MTTIRGQAITVGSLRVTPEAGLLEVRLPFAGFTWQRPVAVVVERAGRVERVRVVDITRLVQVALWATTLLVWLALVARRRS